MGKLAVRAQGVGKRFNLNVTPSRSMVEVLERRLRRWKHYGASISRDLKASRWPVLGRNLAREDKAEFWALKDISFELNHGDVLGIIGPNGAGKSTLLKILSQVTPPTEGRVELHGRIGALLEVGTGFNPELSGRENIYLYGSIIGMDRVDIANRFDEIVEFAEIEKFLEEPIKHYSSGMHSRLAFSVAAHLECDILLVDEVLSVGDAAFRSKCLGKMQDVTGQGRAVIFVSHNMSAVRNMCSTALVLQDGEIDYYGTATEAIEHYMQSVSTECENEVSNPIALPDDQEKEIKIRELYIRNSSGEPSRYIEYIDGFTIGMKVDIKEASKDYYNAIWLQDHTGNMIIFSTDEDTGQSLISQMDPGVYEFSVDIPGRLLAPGDYRVVWATCRQKKGKVDRYDNLIPLSITDTHTWRGQRGLYRRGVTVAPELEWQVSAVTTSV